MPLWNDKFVRVTFGRECYSLILYCKVRIKVQAAVPLRSNIFFAQGDHNAIA